MKEKYKGKIKVPFCVKYSSTVPLDKLGSLLFEISGEEEFYVFRCWNYYGINVNEDVDYWDTPQMFGENTAVYTLEELQAIVDEVNNDTATLTEDEYVDVGEDETVSNESVESNTIIKDNISFDVTINGQTFNLTPEELQDLYLQLCVAEGTLQDWRLGQ